MPTTRAQSALTALACAGLLAACSDGSSDGTTGGNANATDISDAILSARSADCAQYSNDYRASVVDIQRSLGFDGALSISNTGPDCTFTSNSIPNHNFNDATARFADDVAEVSATFTVTRAPIAAASTTALSQQVTNAVMLNGAALDMLSAGCYRPNDAQADADGNVHIGCGTDDPWLLDPLGTDHKFGADTHNAHTQPGGLYHYHGNPNALFDDNPGPDGSPVIGFAADGFPVYGSYFLDPDTGQVRKALSGYTLRSGSRGTRSDTNPGGDFDGTYVDDWAFTDAGDLDACNGMRVDGQYGYYVTDTYPWVIACFTGTPHDSFTKSQGGGGPPPRNRAHWGAHSH